MSLEREVTHIEYAIPACRRPVGLGREVAQSGCLATRRAKRVAVAALGATRTGDTIKGRFELRAGEHPAHP
jgi:hypothetical protein